MKKGITLFRDKIIMLFGKLGSWLKKIKDWPLQEKIMVFSCAGAAIIAIAAGSILLFTKQNYEPKAELVSAAGVAAEIRADRPEVATGEAVQMESTVLNVETPQFKTCFIAGESMEKDLTLYIKGEDKKKISGIEFQVKLVTPKEAEKLKEEMAQIEQVNQKLEALSKGETVEISEEHRQELTARLAESVAASDGVEYVMPELSPETIFLMDKQTAVAAYADKLASLSGEVYTDKDTDGMIHVKSINAGSYVACYMPVQAYDAMDYTVDVTVKDKVEYKAVQTIEDKAVAYKEAGDTQESRQGIKVEAVLVDTVKYIESSTKKVEAVYELTKAAPLKTEVGAIYSVTKEVKDEIPAETPEEGTPEEGQVPEGGEAEEGEVTEQKASMSVNKSAVIFSGNSSLDTIELAFSSENVKEVRESFEGSAITLEKKDSETYVLKAGDVKKDTAVKVTFQGTPAGGTEPISITCEVKVIGSTTQLKSADAKELFMDAAGKTPATVADYDEKESYYRLKEEGYTIYYGWQNINGQRFYFDENGKFVTGKQIISGVEYRFGSDGVLLTKGYGIDVSKWQGNIDWAQASKAISFAIIRCGFRGTSGRIAADPYFDKNIVNAKANGVKVGVYFYSRATNEVQAVEEASLAVSMAKKYGISLPIYIDMEDECQLGLTTEQRMAVIRAFCTTVQNSGFSAGVYANKNWLTNYLKTDTLPGNISIWCAQYNTKCTYTGRYDIWQYSSKGSVPGIQGNVDMNISFF